MKLISKAVLGALALASVGAVAMPANAQVSVTLGTPRVVVPERNPCFRAPEFRPAFCFRHDMARDYWTHRPFAYNYDRDRERERERQATLDRQYRDYGNR